MQHMSQPGLIRKEKVSGIRSSCLQSARHLSSTIGKSAANAYLTPDVLRRPNLTVAVETTVTRILFSTSSTIPCATGVELAKGPDDPSYQVNARREVLCCAGAIKTPQILMLSGIGPKGELQRLNIPAVKELEAVGRNLYDVRTVHSNSSCRVN